MFDIAFSELVVIGLIALVVLGPKRLPEMARAAGRWMAHIRRFVEDVKRDVGSELRREELAELRQVHQQLTETRQIFENTASSAISGIADSRPSETAPGYLVKALPEPDVTAPTPKKRTPKSARKKPARPKTKKNPARNTHVRASRNSKS
ncbi:MAG TPA: Sec-independent protein translocase protein TatB [Acidiferrobacterales bacterium]|nr:Sec-independent protein translocase protein TatB [Acidiferrobacterales bacterium]